MARSVMLEMNFLTTSRLTSASSKLTRISAIASSMSLAERRPREVSLERTDSNFSDKVLNILGFNVCLGSRGLRNKQEFFVPS